MRSTWNKFKVDHVKKTRQHTKQGQAGSFEFYSFQVMLLLQQVWMWNSPLEIKHKKL